MASYTLSSPLKVCYYTTKGGDKRWFVMNLNQYRNTHYSILHNAKEEYSLLMKSKVQHLPTFTNPIHIHYKVFTGSAIKSDVMNWVAVIDKFFQDVLVREHKLIDDNYLYVPKITCEFGGIDKQNPRLEIEIVEQGLTPLQQSYHIQQIKPKQLINYFC